jgi:Tc5 transposase-like DNA-binding protein
LYEWHCRAEKKITLSGNGLIERTKKFWIALAPIRPNTEEPKWSPGWLAGFKTRFRDWFGLSEGELLLEEEQAEYGQYY